MLDKKLLTPLLIIAVAFTMALCSCSCSRTDSTELEQFQAYSVMVKLPAIRSTSKNGIPIPIFQRLGYIIVQTDMNYYGNN